MVVTMTNKRNKATEVYEALTAQVIDAIENNPGDWSKPWREALSGGVPFNAHTRNAYRGGNIWSLIGQTREGVPAWATYRQWKKLGCQVRKGETGTHCVKWVKPRCKAGHAADVRCGVCPDHVFPSVFSVHHWSQTEGGAEFVAENFPVADKADHERHETAERFIAATGARITHSTAGRAFYSPQGDFVNVPEIGDFHNPEGFYATVAHELVHWSGHRSRLAREGIVEFDRFGSPRYAREELVAELGSVFVCAGHLGIDVPVREDHAAYLDSWLKVLKADPKALWTAASQAGKAAEFLVEMSDALVPA